MTFVTASLALAFFLRLFFSVPPFFFGWGVTSPCAHMWQPQLVPFIVIPFMRRPHLAASCLSGRSHSVSHCCLLLLLWLSSFFIVYYSFIIIATVRFWPGLFSVCAPLYASMRAPLFQLGQLQIKQNTHTSALTRTQETC